MILDLLTEKRDHLFDGSTKNGPQHGIRMPWTSRRQSFFAQPKGGDRWLHVAREPWDRWGDGAHDTRVLRRAIGDSSRMGIGD